MTEERKVLVRDCTKQRKKGHVQIKDSMGNMNRQMTDSKRPAMSENSKGLVSRMYFKILYINKKTTRTSVGKKLKDSYE